MRMQHVLGSAATPQHSGPFSLFSETRARNTSRQATSNGEKLIQKLTEGLAVSWGVAPSQEGRCMSCRRQTSVGDI